MFFSVLSIVILLTCVGVFLVNMRAGAYATLIAILFAPYIQVSSGLFFRVEHLAFPILLGILCIQSYKSKQPLSCPPIALYYGLWWLVGLLATMLSVATTPDVKIEWLGMYGFLRPFFIILVFVNVFENAAKHVARAARIMVISTIPLGILAVFQVIGVSIARDITEQAFISPGRPVMTNQLLMETAGYLFRALSVFENVSFAGTYFLLAVFTGVVLLHEHNQTKNPAPRWPILLGTIAGVAGGIATLSATFVGGVVVLVGVLILNQDRRRRRALLIPIAVVSAILALVVFLLPEENDLMAAMTYQVTKVFSFSGLSDRYDSGSGQTADAVQATNERPLVGWGFVTQPDVVVNDSMYVTFYYYSGLLGMAVLIWLMAHLYMTVAAGNIHRQLFNVWIVIIVISGVSCTSMYIPRVGDWWWALAAMAYRLAPSRERRSVSAPKQRLAENPGL